MFSSSQTEPIQPIQIQKIEQLPSLLSEVKQSNPVSSSNLAQSPPHSPSISSSSHSAKHRRNLRRRRSQIVRNSIQGTLQFLPANFFPNLPRPQPGLLNLIPIKKMPKRGGGHKVIESKRLAAAEHCKAKTVFFYKDGDDYFTGVRVPISKSRFRTMDALMDSLNESIPLPFGVRRLHTPTGKTTIHSLDDLQPQGRYVAASTIRRVRGVDMEAVERRKRLRDDAQRRWNFQQQTSANTDGSQRRLSRSAAGQSLESSTKSDDRLQQSSSAGIRRQQALAASAMNGESRSRFRQQENEFELTMTSVDGRANNPFMPVTSKQLFFVLNGHPHRVYRALVNPLRRGELEPLLEEVSEGLQAAIFRIYSFEGDRILNMEQLLQLKDMRAIAVPRHERLMLNGMIQSDILRIPPMRQLSNNNNAPSSSLPPIGKGSKSSSKSSSGGSQSKVRQPNNNIDRLPAYDDPKGGGRIVGTIADSNRRKRSRSPLPPPKEHLPKAAFLNGNGASNGTVGNGIRQRAHSTSASVPKQNSLSKTSIPSIDAPTAASTSNTTADSDSGRPRSAMEMELIGQEDGNEDKPIYEEEEKNGLEEEEEEDDEGDEDDYPEEPPELKALRKSRKNKQGKKKEEEIIDEEEEERIEANNEEEEGKENEKKTGENEALNEEDREMLRQVFQEDEPKEAENKSTGAMQIEVIHRDENGDIISGEYSDELERILYGQAAVKIQSAWRGYAVRKELKRTRFAEHPIYINGDGLSSRRGGKNTQNGSNNNNALYKPNERHQAIVSRVKTPMPGHKVPTNSVLKKKSSMLDPDYGTETMIDSSSDREDTNVTELLQAKKSLGWEMATPEKSPSLSRRSPKTDYVYTITVITGNRWAADTEADLYIILHGADKNSEKLWLRQEFTNWLQSGPSGQRFRQNQSDSFTFSLPQRIGIIKKITVGHECRGYGAGIFIDRILVTEDEEAAAEEAIENGGEDCRQFMFLCNKWFDSGQVDGKLERTIRLSAFYEIGSIPIENRVTRGRWEFILHNGTERGQGGTTSLLAITGYGTRGQSTTKNLYDSTMTKVPSESLIQVDFGDIGELLKVRIEIDGNGDKPDYFLNFVEFKDLDTEERFVVMCGKWLRSLGNKKGDQPFRELFAFHIGVEPLPLICYDGKIRVLSPRIDCPGCKEVKLELYGDLGETGFFRVDISQPELANKSENANEEDEENNDNGNGGNGNTTDKIDIAFKVEAVSVGRVIGAKVLFEPNQIGQEIMEGLLAVQNMFQRQGCWPLQSNSEFLIGRILLRESQHTPYRYVLTRSQFKEMSEQICTKEMLTTEMEGISTRRPKRKQGQKAKSNWLLQMSLGIGSSLLPEVILCGENGIARLLPLDSSPSDWMLSYQPENSTDDIGTLRKIRIQTDGQHFLTGIDLDEVEKVDDQPPFSLVQKIRICDTANGDELRFPTADCHLQRHSVYEMSAIWPDRPPIPIVIYLIRIVTGEANFQPLNSAIAALNVRLNFGGEFGDVGWRTLSSEEMELEENGPPIEGPSSSIDEQQSPQITLFAPKTRNSFEFEAVSIGELQWAEVEVRSEQSNFTWECKELVVTDTNTALFYTFQFERQFSADCPLQHCATLPFTNAL